MREKLRLHIPPGLHEIDTFVYGRVRHGAQNGTNTNIWTVFSTLLADVWGEVK